MVARHVTNTGFGAANVWSSNIPFEIGLAKKRNGSPLNVNIRVFGMTYAKKIVLHCREGYRLELDSMVEDFIRDGVSFVGVVGKECVKVEDIIDELVVGDGSNQSATILTSSHPGKSVDDAIKFAKSLTGKFAGDEVQVVEL
jgi:hypothetical protein